MKVIEDFKRLTRSGSSLVGKVFIDRSKSKAAHRDFVQLIPKSIKHGRWQYMGGKIKDIQISNNIFLAPHALTQGIFCSDGLVENLTAVANIIQTSSFHEITICGLINGVFRKNYSANLEHTKIRLYPLRIGGGLGKKIWIMTFKDKSLKYKPLENYSRVGAEDFRFKPHNDTDVFLYDFDLEAFQKEAVKIKNKDIKVFIKKLKKLSMGFGKEK